MSKQQPGNVPSQATFFLKLSKVTAGGAPVVNNASCEFTYIWDFKKNMGLAQLMSIDNCKVDITLHPIGAGNLDFMSDITPTAYVINGQKIIIDRVMLDIELQDNKRSAAIMFNADGSCIQETENFTQKH